MKTIAYSVALLVLMSEMAAAELVVLSFSGPSCPFCRQIDATWSDADVQREAVGVERIKVDIEKSPAVAAEYGVAVIPTTVVVEFRDGKRIRTIARETGAIAKSKLIELIKKAKPKR